MSFCLASLAEYPIRHPVLFLFLQSYRKYSPKYYGADQLYTPATLLTEKVSVTKFFLYVIGGVTIIQYHSRRRQKSALACNLYDNERYVPKETGMEMKGQNIPQKTVTNKGGKSLETVVSLLKQVAFIMFIISQPCSLELCLYKLSVGTLVLPFRSIPILNNI